MINKPLFDKAVVDEATKKLIDSLKQTCGSYGLGNDGNEYKIIIQVFLYKYFNDKFAYEAKRVPIYGERLSKAEKWDEEYDKFSDDEIEELFAFLPANTPHLRPEHTIHHLNNKIGSGDFSFLFDSTMVNIAHLNADIFSMATVNKTKLTIFEEITVYIPDSSQRDEFAIALMRHIAKPETNFEAIFSMKYDFFSTMFEYLIKDYNKDGGGKYAEYYTPRSIADIMARLLVGEEKELRGVTCYDPSAGSGTLLMALAHQVGEDRCTIYSQDISQKSSKMLRLNLILNNLVGSIQNIIQGNTLLNPGHRDKDGKIKKFDFIVSNPPFKLDFPDERDTIAKDNVRFWAGVPNVPKEIDPDKPKMEIYLCFIQHMLYSLDKNKGRGAIVVPTGFITGKSGIKKKILEKIVDQHIVYGVVKMPSKIFATTGTNVSVLFFDNSKKQDKVVLIDASNMGHDEKDGNNMRTFLDSTEIDTIVETFLKKEAKEDFSVVVSHEEIKKKKYSLSAGQYFDVKIEYDPITDEEYKSKISTFKQNLSKLFSRAHDLETKIISTTDKIVKA